MLSKKIIKTTFAVMMMWGAFPQISLAKSASVQTASIQSDASVAQAISAFIQANGPNGSKMTMKDIIAFISANANKTSSAAPSTISASSQQGSTSDQIKALMLFINRKVSSAKLNTNIDNRKLSELSGDTAKEVHAAIDLIGQYNLLIAGLISQTSLATGETMVHALMKSEFINEIMGNEKNKGWELTAIQNFNQKIKTFLSSDSNFTSLVKEMDSKSLDKKALETVLVTTFTPLFDNDAQKAKEFLKLCLKIV